MKKEAGITIIALVVTVVILLILAIVAVSLINGNSGLLTQTETAKNKYEEAQRNEKIELEGLEQILGLDTKSSINSADFLALQQRVDALQRKLDEIGTIYHGTIVTNTMGGPNTVTVVNNFTVTKAGNYNINALARMNWLKDSGFGIYIQLVRDGVQQHIAANVYLNNQAYTPGWTNVTVDYELQTGDVIEVLIYQSGNGAEGANNLTHNDLQLMYMGE